jgi:hypothetical protein
VKKKDDVKVTEAPKGGKQPFWKKMKFGSAAMEQQSEVQEPSHMEQDHTIPAQELHRKGGRGT